MLCKFLGIGFGVLIKYIYSCLDILMFGVGYLMLNDGDKVVFGVKLYKKKYI